MNLPKTASEIEHYVLAFLSVDQNGHEVVQHGFETSYASIYHICHDDKLADITEALIRAFKRIQWTTVRRFSQLNDVFSYYNKIMKRRSQANPFREWTIENEMYLYGSRSTFGDPCR